MRSTSDQSAYLQILKEVVKLTIYGRANLYGIDTLVCFPTAAHYTAHVIRSYYDYPAVDTPAK